MIALILKITLKTLAPFAIAYVIIGLYGLIDIYGKKQIWLPEFEKEMRNISMHIIYVFVFPLELLTRLISR